MSLDRLWRDCTLGFSLDWSACPAFSDDSVAWTTAFSEMAELEGGSIANPDEGRQVGHYWLRTPELAPEGLGAQIRAVVSTCKKFAFALKKEGKFKTALILGIGGSALGPAFLSSALQEPEDWMRLVFIDNTDPEGMARVIGPLDLEETLVVCISKSGGTPETRNALIEVQAAFGVAGLPFAEHAVAISQEGSRLWKEAEGWKLRLPMWDWVGGRTSVTSAVGLLPLALQGADVELLLEGAAAMDAATRIADLEKNPAAILARAWYNLGEGRGKRAMVVLPYRDRLLLFSRYLQQLVMESLGKEKDLAGNLVYQGLTVYGNKGSTDQHAYVQQLRDGPDDHFVTLIGVLDDGFVGEDVEPGIHAGDYLQGFLMGTWQALQPRHPVLMLTMDNVDAFRLGALVALYERAVGLYAFRIGINAYHQPGVEAGKKAATGILAAKLRLREVLSAEPQTAAQLAAAARVDPRTAWYLLSRMGAMGELKLERGEEAAGDRFLRVDAG